VYGSRDSSRLLRLRVLKAVFCFLVLLPVLAVTPVFGQESVITLAKISFDQSPAKTAAAKRKVSAATPLVYMPAPRLQYRTNGLMAEQPDTSLFLSVLLSDSKDDSDPCDWSRFVYKKPSIGGWMGSRVHVEAGYGQFCQFESSLGQNGVELEQPSCAYFRASFSF
jgi:hypothetical protein